MIRLSLAFSLAFVVCGCTDKDQAEQQLGSTDVRVDHPASDNDPDSGGTQMCVNDNGEIFVVWVDDRDGTPDIWFNRSLDLGVQWMPSDVKINRGFENNVWDPAIGCNNDGVFVAWEDDRDGELQNHQIYFSRSLDQGDTWSVDDLLLELDPDGLSFSQGPQVAVDGSNVHVVWYDNINGAYDIYMATSENDGETWGDPVRVDSDEPAGSAFSGAPQVVAVNQKDVYVVWEDTRDGNSDIYFARSDNSGSSFKSDKRLDGGDDNGANNSFAPKLDADGDNVFVVWHDTRNGEGRDVFFNFSSDNGKNWSNTAQRMDSDQPAFFNSTFPVVSLIGDTAHVAWQDNRFDGYDIFYRLYNGFDPQGEEVRVDLGDNEGFTNSTTPIIADNGTDVAITWQDQRGDAESDSGYNDLYYNLTTGGFEFNEPDLRIDSMEPGQSFKVDVNTHIHGQKLFTVWTDGRLGTSDIFFSSLTLGEESTYVSPAQ